MPAQGAANSDPPTETKAEAQEPVGYPHQRRLRVKSRGLLGGSESAAYRCSRVIHQSARGEPRPGSSSSPRQIVNNSAAPAAAQRWSRGKLSNGHAAPGHESPPLSSNDYKETFGPGASSRSFDEYSDDNRRRFSVSISRGSSGAPWEKSPSN